MKQTSCLYKEKILHSCSLHGRQIMKNILRNSALFFAIWLIVMMVYSATAGLWEFSYLWKITLLPGLVLASVAAFGTILQQNTNVRKGINIIFILFAVGLDQLIKAYLFSLNWESISYAIIPPVFYLDPTQNTSGSYLWVLLKIDTVPHLFNIILFTIIGLLFIEIWRFYTARKRNSFWINGFIHLFLAGLIANIIDNAFWGGSLDYITIRPFYTFDLKDMYITLCELFLVTELIDNKLLVRLFKMPKHESKELNQSFLAFIRSDLQNLFRKKNKQ